jgi:mRNA-degrading endonuclease RelE of RelBE toxin-antitoxin system
MAEILFTSEFKRNIRQLAKKYRRIKSDIQPVIDSLSQGQTPGDQIPNVNYEAYKVRAKNSDSAKGKSGGYRIIYERTLDGKIVLVTIYSKTEQSDIAPHEIRQIIEEFDSQTSDSGMQANEEPESEEAEESKPQ